MLPSKPNKRGKELNISISDQDECQRKTGEPNARKRNRTLTRLLQIPYAIAVPERLTLISFARYPRAYIHISTTSRERATSPRYNEPD